MAGLNKEMLEFLFIGPLFSIFKKLNSIERKQDDMATQADVDALAQRVAVVAQAQSDVAAKQVKALGEIKNEVQGLKDQIAAGTAASDLDLSGLDGKITDAETNTATLVQGAQDLDDLNPDAPVDTTPPTDGGGDTTPPATDPDAGSGDTGSDVPPADPTV